MHRKTGDTIFSCLVAELSNTEPCFGLPLFFSSELPSPKSQPGTSQGWTLTEDVPQVLSCKMSLDVTASPASGYRSYGNGAANIHDGFTPNGGRQ